MQSKLSKLQKTILLTVYKYRKVPFELNRRLLSREIAKKNNKNHSTPSFQTSMCNSLKALEQRKLIESINWGEYRSYVQLTKTGISTVKEIKLRKQKILLVDIDSEIPNLALMKLSSFHKIKGDKVSLLKHPCITGNEKINHKFNKVYISSIFEENKDKTIQFSKQFDNIELGGYFIDSKKELPYKIEHIMPDYDLYGINHSLGFTTRGCNRNCKFCIVPKKEGTIHPTGDIYEFWNTKHKHIVLLDNNILSCPEHFKKICNQINENKLSIDFNQGLDVRLLTEEHVKILSTMKIKPELRFAFDSLTYETKVLTAIKLMKEYNIKRALWYVLVGFNTTWEEDIHRIMLLKEHNQRPYVMRYKTVKEKDHPDKSEYALLASWVNQYRFFESMTFDKFKELTYDRSKINYRNRLKTNCLVIEK